MATFTRDLSKIIWWLLVGLDQGVGARPPTTLIMDLRYNELLKFSILPSCDNSISDTVSESLRDTATEFIPYLIILL